MDTTVATLFTSLHGKWYIHRSTLPLWLAGDKRSPTLNYTYAPDDGSPTKPTTLKDCVRYKSKPWCPAWLSSSPAASSEYSVENTINGTNTATNAANGELLWRGDGLLTLITSAWRVVLQEEIEVEATPDEEGGVMHQPEDTVTGKDEQTRPQPQQKRKVQVAVISFGKTMFTPEGLDVISKGREGLSADVAGRLLAAAAARDEVCHRVARLAQVVLQ